MNLMQIMQYLRNVAEVDPNDIIANSASQLTVELELPDRAERLTEADRDLIRYSISKRNVYILYPGDRHATDTSPPTMLALTQLKQKEIC